MTRNSAFANRIKLLVLRFKKYRLAKFEERYRTYASEYAAIAEQIRKVHLSKVEQRIAAIDGQEVIE
ncbi:MAG: hypothetical protein RBU21_25355 [FCB group bacterium]|jgi:hypothetical protein|nr:hypothetical protein [FCB group bacterium]